jgi:hypothetical protein
MAAGPASLSEQQREPLHRPVDGRLEWVDWFNHRLLAPIGYVPPAEFEADYHPKEDPSHTAGFKPEPSVNLGRLILGVVGAPGWTGIDGRPGGGPRPWPTRPTQTGSSSPCGALSGRTSWTAT